HALIAPDEALAGGGLHPGERHVDERMAALAAGFEQNDPVGRIGAQSVGEYAAGTACADDDEIRLAHAVRASHPSLPACSCRWASSLPRSVAMRTRMGGSGRALLVWRAALAAHPGGRG